MRLTYLKILCVCTILLCSCEQDENKISDYEIVQCNNVKEYFKFRVKSKNGVLFNFYTDKNGNLVQFSDSTTHKFRINFDDNGLIWKVENKLKKANKRIYRFNNDKSSAIITDKNGKMFREIRIYNVGIYSPDVTYEESKFNAGAYFISQYSVFKFSTWGNSPNNPNENVIILNKPQNIYVGNSSIWKFKINSKCNKYKLLKSNWDANFNTSFKIDTI